MQRRQFLATALAAGAGLAAGPAPAIEPIRRTGKPHLRLSLAAYSFSQYLDLTQDQADDDAGRLHRPRRRAAASTPSS